MDIIFSLSSVSSLHWRTEVTLELAHYEYNSCCVVIINLYIENCWTFAPCAPNYIFAKSRIIKLMTLYMTMMMYWCTWFFNMKIWWDIVVQGWEIISIISDIMCNVFPLYSHDVRCRMSSWNVFTCHDIVLCGFYYICLLKKRLKL